MPNILLISAGDSIAHYGKILKQNLPFPDTLNIVNIYMEDAVDYARNSLPEGVDVIIARGNTAKLLKTAHLSVPVVTVPIAASELVQSIEKAKRLYPEEQSRIAYIGLEDVIRSVSAFLEMMHCQIHFYPVVNSKDIEYSIKKAKKDQVRVVIGGEYTQKLAEEYGLNCVLLESSLTSLKEAYERALEVQKGVQLQKKKLQERITMVNAISEGLVSVNDKRRVTLYNTAAERYFKLPSEQVIGKVYAHMFGSAEQALVNQVLLSNQPVIDHLVTLHGAEYLLAINPIIVQHKNQGVILSLHPYRFLAETFQRSRLVPQPVAPTPSFFELTGSSPDFQLAVALGFQYAKAEAPVLIIGAVGSGRETFAQCIHKTSRRSEELFVARTGALLTLEDLLSANRGTLYIRDIETVAPDMIPVLIEMLRHNTVLLPDRLRQPLDIRLMAGSSNDLSRELPGELYYLLNSLILPLPSLAQRKGDIVPLFRHFLGIYGKEFGCERALSSDAADILTDYTWPGNISQLQSLCRRLILIPGEHQEISASMIAKQLDDSIYYNHLNSHQFEAVPVLSPPFHSDPKQPGFIIDDRFVTYEELQSLDQFYQGRKKLVAEHLGISRSTLWRYMKEMETVKSPEAIL